ncbi:hypothetical protein [Pseudonocardia sp. WMMC193]|uniref:hypothetical protein n=1 Tax=Pseudonocardia sp. WMMC193 TaxID=2911965 RepID=UPI001F3A0BA7|nr:hypothetical protein [Pseudonocardia sp. WMMC193]MCF7550876.1 hypothetical protein [Pseudonocardia sp. WMMC193]
MTTFTVRGSRNGSLVHVTWTDGVLTGDFPTVDLLAAEAELVPVVHRDSYAGRALPDLDGLGPSPLSEPGTAYRLILRVFDSVRESEGEVPDMPTPQAADPSPAGPEPTMRMS